MSDRGSVLLSVEDLSVSYGPVAAVRNVSLQVMRGELVLLGGANGAGKSTVLRALSGVVPAVSGRIVFNGASIAGEPAHVIAGRGLRHVPEGRRVWPGLSVAEHLQLAWHGLAPQRREFLRAQIQDLFPRLAERWTQAAGSMSGGEQQMLAIARGLAADPQLLMIDELSLGLAPAIVKQLFAALRRVNRQGMTLLLVEQAMYQALQFAHRGYVLETGRLAVSGSADQLMVDEAVRRAYLPTDN